MNDPPRLRTEVDALLGRLRGLVETAVARGQPVLF
jgi:hypothetical protein